MPSPDVHKGLYKRWYLPHYDVPHACQFITYRLADSLPRERVLELNALPPELRSPRTHEYLDNGYGSCVLKDPRLAAVVEENLLHFHGDRYELFAWVVMANHVHTLVKVYPGLELWKIVSSWKSYTAKACNTILERTGAFWMPDYFDRFARDADDLQNIVNYIEGNPVAAGLVQLPEEWRYSSAGYRAM